MDLGLAIKNIRLDKGLKQKQFSELCNITQTYLSQIENGRKTPNISVLETMGKALSIPLPVLFFLSLTEDDVDENKRESFKMIGPLIKDMINRLFMNDKELNDL